MNALILYVDNWYECSVQIEMRKKQVLRMLSSLLTTDPLKVHVM